MRQCLGDRTCSASCYILMSAEQRRGLTVIIDRDMPPVGGFENVRYKRNLPFRGPGALAILGGVTAVCAYGFYRVGLGNLERR